MRSRDRCYVSHGHSDHAREHATVVTTPNTAHICRARFARRESAWGQTSLLEPVEAAAAARGIRRARIQRAVERRRTPTHAFFGRSRSRKLAAAHRRRSGTLRLHGRLQTRPVPDRGAARSQALRRAVDGMHVRASALCVSAARRSRSRNGGVRARRARMRSGSGILRVLARQGARSGGDSRKRRVCRHRARRRRNHLRRLSTRAALRCRRTRATTPGTSTGTARSCGRPADACRKRCAAKPCEPRYSPGGRWTAAHRSVTASTAGLRFRITPIIRLYCGTSNWRSRRKFCSTTAGAISFTACARWA